MDTKSFVIVVFCVFSPLRGAEALNCSSCAASEDNTQLDCKPGTETQIYCDPKYASTCLFKYARLDGGKHLIQKGCSEHKVAECVFEETKLSTMQHVNASFCYCKDEDRCNAGMFTDLQGKLNHGHKTANRTGGANGAIGGAPTMGLIQLVTLVTVVGRWMMPGARQGCGW